MKTRVSVLVAVAGFALSAPAVVNTRIDMQVTLTPVDGGSWTQRISDIPTGSTVYVRAVVTYVGTGTPLGLASFVFQPTVGNAHSGDTVLPFINGGMGSNTSTPPGVISGGQLNDTTSFGRVSPWGRSATSSTSALRGFFHTNPNGDGLDYLRIAQSQVTSWIGGPGNTSGGSGVNIAQLSNVGRTTSDPAFNSQLSLIYVFKFGIQLDASPVSRTMAFDAPLGGFGNRNTTTGDREIYWWGDMNEASGSIRGTATVTPAYVDVLAPSPGGSALLLGAFALGGVRRRRFSTSAPSAPPRSP